MAQRQIATATGIRIKWNEAMNKEEAMVGVIGGADGPTAVFITSSWSMTDVMVAGMFLTAAVGAVILACWLYRRYKGR